MTPTQAWAARHAQRQPLREEEVQTAVYKHAFLFYSWLCIVTVNDQIVPLNTINRKVSAPLSHCGRCLIRCVGACVEVLLDGIPFTELLIPYLVAQVCPRVQTF